MGGKPKTKTEKRESRAADMMNPPDENPHHCPKCGTPGKYAGRQHQSEKFMLVAWKECECGNVWGYIFPHDKLPDPTTLV